MKHAALIAADVAGPRDVVSGVLARFGFGHPTIVENRQEALERLADSYFDLVILPLQDIDSKQLFAIEREIHRNGRLAVIGTAPSADPDLILRCMRSGVHEFLVSPPSVEELGGAVERVMRRARAESLQGELIAVYSAKGGLGCTTVAVNLAHALALAHPETRVALADLVFGGGDVRVFLNLKPTYDLGHLVDKGERVDADLLHSLMTQAAGGVWALPTGESPEMEDVFDASAIAAILSHLRSGFGITVVDCEHHLSERTVTVLDAASRILIVTQLDVPSLRSAHRTLALCRRLGYDDDKLKVVVNRYQSSDVLSLADAEKLLQCSVSWTLPNDYKLSAAALTKGVPVAEEDRNSKLARSYADLARKVIPPPAAEQPAKDSAAGSRLRKLFGKKKGVANVT